MTKKYTAIPGQKVTLEINRGGRAQIAKRKPQIAKGLLDGRKPEDYQARRLPGTIRIFDWGRLPSGADVADFIIQPPLRPAIEDGFSAGLEDYAARDAHLFALPGETRADKCFEIKREDADLYKLTFFNDGGATAFATLDSESEYWTDKGIKLPPNVWEDSIGVALAPLYEGRFFRSNLFKPLHITGAGAGKVTAVYDYEAEAIPDFKLKAGDRLFLMPEICTYKATTLAFAVTHHVNYDLRLGLREYYADDQMPDLDPSETASYDYEDLYGAVAFHVALGSARAMSVYYDFDLMDYVWTDVPAENALSAFPPTAPPAGSWALTALILFNGFLGATLAAIVERGSQTYYFWQD